uniref:AAA+ ATPase domain-containing protein n=1 Tax=uncultured prokaryote TaxID=198431 RepID=A0A0H5PX83_9ZZZZ|nr:hypothetical protein [uncultured prokaryote]
MKQNKITLIIAKKGTGKTTIASALALCQDKKVFWVTPLDTGFFKKKIDCVGFSELDIDNKLQTCYIVENDLDKVQEHFKRISLIAKNSQEGILLVIDELDYYASSRLHHSSELFKIINYGRHSQLDMIFIARRLQDIPTTTATNVDYFVLGKNLNIKNDVKYYQNFLTDKAITHTQELEIGEFIKVATNSGKISKLILNQDVVNLIERC